jgi:inosose dehydratase
MPSLPAEESIPILARIGFDALELTVVPGWRDELDALTPQRRARIRELLVEHGLGLPALAAHRGLTAADPAEHAENWRRLIGAIDLATELAVEPTPPAIDTAVGGQAGLWDPLRELIVERVGRLCDYAERRGVTIAVEPHVASALDTPDRVLALLRAVGRPNLKVTFDTSHFNVQGIPIEESVAKLAPVTVFTQVKDERGRVPDYEFLIPGEGEFDYGRFLRAMDAAGYRGDVHVEISLMVQRRPGFDPIAVAEQSYRVLAEAFRQAGIQRPPRPGR